MQVGHYLYQFLWQSHFSAPVEEKLISGGRVLDVGCNPGTWLFEIASAYPLTDFIGIDINPLFPSPSDISQHNIKFVQADVLDKLPFEDDSFDYIRMALFSNTFTHDEWQPALQELIRVLKPGGFIELMEPDYRLQNMGPDSVQLVTSLLQYLSLQHVNGEIVHKLQLLLAATNGLGDIDHSVRSLPISHLGGKTGVLLEDSFFIYCNEVVGEPLADFMELSLGEYEELLQRVKKEFVTFETFCRVYRFWAVKNR
ncbi:445_t:CDS:2 [Paraglomus occultum]|uniref:445_t:CDS:1 n=1 Tax=Paraglomus occultum TaxID=144539 RepID=A0A9N8VIL5_9GLOM|nr:445_t:CDS:2 [Paraglomus occultum]